MFFDRTFLAAGQEAMEFSENVGAVAPRLMSMVCTLCKCVQRRQCVREKTHLHCTYTITTARSKCVVSMEKVPSTCDVSTARTLPCVSGTCKVREPCGASAVSVPSQCVHRMFFHRMEGYYKSRGEEGRGIYTRRVSAE